MDYLDNKERDNILDLFEEKQSAKDTPSYIFYKILLNAAFGNKCRRMEGEDIAAIMDNTNYYYPEGVWIAAIQRHIMADIIWELGDDFIYTNTDSIVCNDTPRARQILEDFNETIGEAELGRFKIEEFPQFFMLGISRYCLWKNRKSRKIVFAGVHQEKSNLTPDDLEKILYSGIIIKNASTRIFKEENEIFIGTVAGKKVLTTSHIYKVPRDLTIDQKIFS